MKKLGILAGGALFFAGCVFAQTETTTTTTKTWNGTLVDASCYQTRTQSIETSKHKTKTQTTVYNDCPVTTTTKEFGVVSPGGEYVQFDQPSSERVVEMIGKHHRWHTYITDRKPINVHVIGVPGSGGEVVVREIE